MEELKILVSIIIPLYHGQKYISQLLKMLESALEGSISSKVEIIFVNDDPKEIISCDNSFWGERLKIINTKINRGIHGAKLLGLSESKGEYIHFLDQDDYIDSRFYIEQIEYMNNGADVVICRLSDTEKLPYSQDCPFQSTILLENIITKGNRIGPLSTALIRREAIPEEWSSYSLKCNGADDWYMWICLISKKCRIELNDDVLFQHVNHKDNCSRDLYGMQCSRKEMCSVIQSQGILSEENFKKLDECINRNERKDYELLKKMYESMQYISLFSELKLKKQYISNFLLNNGIKRIAIYGYGFLGKWMAAEIYPSVEITYLIDRRKEIINSDFPIYLVSEALPEVDAVFFSVFDKSDVVRNEFESKFKTKIFDLKELYLWMSK